MAYNYRQINFDVMSDTEHCCRTIPELSSGIEYSIANQYMVAEEDNIDQPLADSINTFKFWHTLSCPTNSSRLDGLRFMAIGELFSSVDSI